MFTDLSNISDVVVALFNSLVYLLMKIEIFITDNPKVACFFGRGKGVAEDVYCEILK